MTTGLSIAEPKADSWRKIWPLALLGLATLFVWPTVALVDDVSWLITVCERILDGQRLYVDVIEANPPASVWLYLPAVALSRLIWVAPELVINLQIVILLAGSLWVSTALLSQAHLLRDQNLPLLLALGAGSLILLPNGVFGQREHIIVLLLLPVLSSLALSGAGGKPSTSQALFCGILAGIAIAIKVYYIFAIGGALSFVLVSLRSWRPAFALHFWVMTLTFAAYIVAVYLFAPAFLHDILPILSMVYLPIRRPLEDLVFSSGFGTVCATTLLTILCSRGQGIAIPVKILLGAALGSTLPFFIQGKNWPNHIFPMVHFALLALAFVATDKRIVVVWQKLLAVLGLLLLSQPASNWLKDVTGAADLRQAVLKLQPHPKLLYIGHVLRFAHPLVRQIEGTYVGRVCYQWITIGAEQRKAESSPDAATLLKLDALIEQDRQWLIADLKQNSPDVVLVQIAGYDWSKWIAQSHELTTLLHAYAPRGTYDGVQIFQKL